MLRTVMAILYVGVIVLGIRFPLLGIVVFGLMGLMVIGGKRKKWCSSYCPRGSFLDLAASKVSPRKPIPKWMFGRATRYTALAVFIALFSFQLWNAGFLAGWPEDGLIALGNIFVRMCVISSAVALPLALWKNQRAWCSMCPVGNLLRRI